MNRKPQFLTPLITEELLGSKYARLFRSFRFYSVILDRVIQAPFDFVCDYESVPWFKATSKRGGVAHDYLCRQDSVPVVSKKIAADVYLEMMTCRDALLLKRDQATITTAWQKALLKAGTLKRLCRRQAKYWVVRVWPGYFHKHAVDATYEDLRRG